MKKSLPTVTIGIPAYNEEKNLRHLVPQLLSQTRNNYHLKKIYILSDGSTDQTKNLNSEFDNLPVKLILGKKRRGKPQRLNEIFSYCKTDIVVIIDADTKLSSLGIIDLLTSSILPGSYMMVSGHVVPFPPQNLFERIAFAGVSIWNVARSKVAINSLYNCDGMIRAFSKGVYQAMRFKGNSAEDSYSYLTVVSKGWQFVAVKTAFVWYRLPSTFKDYVAQQRRYLTSIDIMALNFPEDLISRELTITPSIKLDALLSYILKDPIYTLLYLTMSLYVRLTLYFKPQSHSAKWEILETTKRIHN